jgi:uncharacterized membrane protein YiaA
MFYHLQFSKRALYGLIIMAVSAVLVGVFEDLVWPYIAILFLIGFFVLISGMRIAPSKG